MEREAAKGPEQEVQCILMDASMDVMDGLECTRVIRATQLPHRVRPFIIALTAHATADYSHKCIASGMVSDTGVALRIKEHYAFILWPPVVPI